MEEEGRRGLGEIAEEIARGRGVLKVTGLAGSSARYLAAAASIRTKDSALFVTTEKRFDRIEDDLEFYLRDAPSGHSLLTLPPLPFAPYEHLVVPVDLSVARMRTLLALGDGASQFILISSIGSLMTKVIPRDLLFASRQALTRGEDRTPESIVNTLVRYGYTRTGIVTAPGDFSARGGIIDVFPPGREAPVRIEFFGDTVESLREFDVLTQRSIEELNAFEIAPVSEPILVDDALKRGIRWIRRRGAELDTPIRRIMETARELEGYRVPPGLQWAAGAFYGRLETLVDYLPKECLVFVDEPELVWEQADRLYDSAEAGYARTLDRKEPALAPEELFIPPDRIRRILGEGRVVQLNPTRTAPSDRVVAAAAGDHRGLRAAIAHKKWDQTMLSPLADKITETMDGGGSLVLVCLSGAQGRRMKSLLSAHGVDLEVTEQSLWRSMEPGRGGVILVGALGEGFDDPSTGLVVITEEEIFGTKVKIRAPRRPQMGEAIESTDALVPGGLVVHSRFGIGRYMGLVNLKVMGVTGDFIHLEYDGNDRLYIPIDRISLVHRYRGGDGRAPALDRLGSGAWEKTKKKVRAEILAMARELAALYAARQALPGHRFSKPGVEFGEFEALFPFEETPDQLSAVTDIIADMTGPTPMDRLVAGDVGYGKTEVAMRASFVAVMDAKQVALVVPTTILAEQHFNTFRERFGGWPVEVRMLSRFLSKKEQKEVVEGLREGKVDIVIGTHRLLGKDIAFSNLGLLIIDEEHRFGVTHKEKIVKMKTQVDVLTMTATPIPRTLSMSMMGIRDISVINTPPPNRLSVKTYVSEFDPEVIKEAISREIGRNGQVFFVHNRIKSIAAMKNYLVRLVPGVKIGVAHGKMDEHELERVMLDFVDKQIDLLLSTAIIESGLDIPAANTIIVNRADTFGLAQLYQIRGRVGRSTVRAYAYLLVPSSLSMTPDAQKRLRVISEFTELGSGLKIAEYDLEIRGAGNLLGADQSGHINAVGYETYQEMVREALREIKGEKVAVEIDPEIQLPLSAFIPEGYIPDPDIRLGLYRRLIGIKDAVYLREVAAEITDRFGPPPTEVRNLIDIVGLKAEARGAGIAGMKYRKGVVQMTFSEGVTVDTEGIVALIGEDPQTLGVTPDGILKFRPSHGERAGLVGGLKNVLQRVSRYVSF
jgi:transcription-repair coupling factor (superfamily II helicase)